METQCLIYILEAKIQRQRLQDMKEAAKRRNINTSERLSPEVTHIITEFKEADPVLRKLNKSNMAELGNIDLVTVEWFTDCMKAERVVPVQEKHRIQSAQPASNIGRTVQTHNVYRMPEYACQRATPLIHFNKKLTDSLEVLELHAELRNLDHDYSRALAFRRASCVLKCLPFTLTSVHQLRKVTNIGDHSRRVIQDILEDGSCAEIEHILNSPWFQKMKLFSGIFGIGSAKAKELIEKGWSSIEEVQKGYSSTDRRVQWGLAFYEDLALPVSMKEAEFVLSEVERRVDKLVPGSVLQLIGGFRRGKTSGHDVDILITHPKMGKENSLLPRLLKSLQSHDMILSGRYEKSTYTESVLTQDSKLSMRGQLDHFEKWLGIVKVPKLVREENEQHADKNKAGKLAGNRNTSKKEEVSKQKNDAIELSDDRNSTKNKGAYRDKNEEIQLTDYKNSTHKDVYRDRKEAIELVDERNSTNNRETWQHSTCIKKSEESNDDIEIKHTDESIEDGGDVLKQAQLDFSEIIELSKEARDWTARRVDLIIAPYDQYFYALVGWTGNKMFNRDLRLYAERERRMKLTSHGLYDFDKGQKLPASSEEEVFAHLQVPYREPYDRNC